MAATTRKLALRPCGVGQMTWPKVTGQEGVTLAAWQTPELDIPKRVVVRIDGVINNALDTDGNGGFPCAVARVDYTQGGMSKSVLVDPQSSLPVHAQSIEVTPVWDQRRIDRLAVLDLALKKPCKSQNIAAAMSVGDDSGDTGPADARYLDVIKVDASDDTTEWSVHPIPNGCRGFRFLDTLVDDEMVSVPGLTSIIALSVQPFSRYPSGVIQLNDGGVTDTSILITPAHAAYLFLGFPTNTIATFDIPAWVEFIMGLETLPGY